MESAGNGEHQILRHLRRQSSFNGKQARLVHPNSGDRFIPSRRNSDVEFAHFKVKSSCDSTSDAESPVSNCDGTPVFKRRLSLLSRGQSDEKIFTFSHGHATECLAAELRDRLVMEDDVFSPPPAWGRRKYIPTSPEKVMSMTDLRDDIFTDVLDWSCTDMVTVGIGNMVFLWNADSKECKEIGIDFNEQDSHVSVVRWNTAGSHLAIGTTDGFIQIWDAEDEILGSKIRHKHEHCDRHKVYSLEWSGSYLFGGYECGTIIQHDPHEHDQLTFSANAHVSGVWALRLSPCGNFLASAAADQQIIIWRTCDGSPHLKLTPHTDGGKAIAWCPWARKIIATGGGVEDGYIRCWNIKNGHQVAEAKTRSEICAILWSDETKELVSAHDGETNNIRIWKYPNLELVMALSSHQGRVLHLATNAQGRLLASTGADQVLMLWKCFENPIEKRKKSSPLALGSPLWTIR